MAQKGNIIIKDMLELMPQFKNLELKYLSLHESTELDILNILQKHSHTNHSKSAHAALEREEAITGIFKMRHIPVVDNHKWRNLLFMVEVEDL